MAYDKQTWQTGDVVTSAKLNHMEDGIAAGGALVVTKPSTATGYLNHTWQEIHDAAPLVWFKDPESEVFCPLYLIGSGEQGYGVGFRDMLADENIVFMCNSPSDYPEG